MGLFHYFYSVLFQCSFEADLSLYLSIFYEVGSDESNELFYADRNVSTVFGKICFSYFMRLMSENLENNVDVFKISGGFCRSCKGYVIGR